MDDDCIFVGNIGALDEDIHEAEDQSPDNQGLILLAQQTTDLIELGSSEPNFDDLFAKNQQPYLIPP